MSVGTVEDVSSTDAAFQKLINDQIEDQRRQSAEFARQFAENRERLALAMDEAKRPRVPISDPSMGELHQLLTGNPALIPATLQFAKSLLVKINAAVAAELEKAAQASGSVT